jgi:hypothetical protein
MSPLPDPKALAVNDLAVSWDGMNAYAFPPTPLIQVVLNKVTTDNVRLCLIAPCWPSQAWFPTDSSRRTRFTCVWSRLVRTLLAQPSLVSNSTRVVDRPPQEAPWVGSPPLAPFRASLPQLLFFLQASRLGTIGCILRAKEFSEDTVSCLTLAQRRGTIDSYQSKWSVYKTWCGKEGVHPVFITLPKLVDFLNHLFKERKLSVSAIKGYKSALATSLRLIGCWENVLDDTCTTALRSMSVAILAPPPHAYWPSHRDSITTHGFKGHQKLYIYF